MKCKLDFCWRFFDWDCLLKMADCAEEAYSSNEGIVWKAIF